MVLCCIHCGSDGEETMASTASATGGSGGTNAGGSAAEGGATSASGGMGGAGGLGGEGGAGGTGGSGGTLIEGLDPTFSGGLVTAGLGLSFDDIRAGTRQPDGKIVVAGSTGFDVAFPQAASEVLVVRFESDGTVDTGFGAGGQALVAAHARAFANAVVVQPDGKIVIVGGAQEWRSNVVNTQRTLVARLNADGSLDTSFGGGDGVVLEPFALFGTGVALQADGKIVVSSANNSIFRYDASGARDGSFGANGLVSLPFGSAGYRTSVGIAADGGILTTYEQLSGTWAVTRLGSDGSVDTSYGTNGSFTTAGFYTRREAVLADGSVVLCGTDLTEAAILRVDEHGALDTSFGGGDGLVTVDLPAGFDTFLRVAIDDAGRILVSNPDAIQIARFLSDGTLDASYGTSGVASPGVGFTAWEVPLISLPSGPVLATGMKGDHITDVGPMAAVRLDADGVVDASFAGGTGTLVHDSHAAPDIAVRSHAASNGTILTSGTSHGFAKLKEATVTRHLQDGSLDTTFGNGGWVRLSGASLVRDSALLSDDSIIVAGWNFELEKLTATGAIDTSYGAAGTADLAPVLGNSPRIGQITRDGSDRVIAVGLNTASEFLIVRVATDGSLDASFDDDGVVALPIQTLGGFTAVTTSTSGAILAAGPANDNADVVVVRVLADGSLDTSWGTAGQAIVGPHFEPGAIKEQPGGAVLVAGYRTSPDELVIGRLDASGALDTTFGSSGWIQVALSEPPLLFGSEQRGPGLAVLSDGSFFVTAAQPGALQTTTVMRYDVDGVIDSTFGSAGTLAIAPYGNWIFVDATLQADGKLLLTGRGLSQQAGTEFGIARLE